LELADTSLEQAVGLAELVGHLIEQGERLLQTSTTGLLKGRRGAWHHRLDGADACFHLLLSHNRPSEDGQVGRDKAIPVPTFFPLLFNDLKNKAGAASKLRL